MNTRPLACFLTLLVLAWSGCVRVEPGGAPSTEQLAEATYSGIYDRPIRLHQGNYDGKPFVPGGASRPTVRLLDKLATGELNGEAGEESAVLLAENSGGSGVFVYLALVSMRGGKTVNLDTVLLGDRVQVRQISIVDSRIRLDLLERDPGNATEPAGRAASQTWRFLDGRLVRDGPGS